MFAIQRTVDFAIDIGIPVAEDQNVNILVDRSHTEFKFSLPISG